MTSVPSSIGMKKNLSQIGHATVENWTNWEKYMQHKFLASGGFEPVFFEIHNLISNFAKILDFARKNNL